MKKYNMHEIMANAWNIRRTNNVSMSTALRAAWALAKAVYTNAWNRKRNEQIGYVDSMTGEFIAA